MFAERFEGKGMVGHVTGQVCVDTYKSDRLVATTRYPCISEGLSQVDKELKSHAKWLPFYKVAIAMEVIGLTMNFLSQDYLQAAGEALIILGLTVFFEDRIDFDKVSFYRAQKSALNKLNRRKKD